MMPQVPEPIVSLLLQHPIMRHVRASELRHLATTNAVLHLDTGELLHAAGQRADRIFVLLGGALQIEYPKPGEQRGPVIAILQAPGLLGECQVMHDRCWSGTGVALRSITALGLHRETMEELISGYPAFALNVYRELTLRFLRAIEAWKHAPTVQPPERLARYIISYLEAVDPQVQHNEVALRQTELGRATDLRRETINRLLRKWEAEKRLTIQREGLSAIKRHRLQELLGDNQRTLTQEVDLP
ncbi:MAG: Crp/Fnr family transcriptional regulator [Myxococcota bacterium]